jgi:hypothetical protein
MSVLRKFGVWAAPLALLSLSAASLAQGPVKPKAPGTSPAVPSAVPSAAPAPATAAPAAAASEDADKAQAKQLARTHFDKAVTLQEEEAWAPALAEFRESMTLFPTRAATKNAAVCLQKLERYDEALETFQALLRDYPNLTAEDKALAQRAIGRLQGLVGTLELVGGEAAASVVVDGKGRGETPVKAALRVSAGSHVVRVYKDGYLPFETRIDVAGGQATRVEVKLAALTQSGRLKVSESKGRALDVVVDNVVVGKTPWEGALAPGAHSVWLRGGEEFGTQPATGRVKVNEVTALNLVAEDLEAWVRVEPTPAGAAVSIDAVEVGRGVWEGRVRLGDHRIEVADDGFIASSRKLTLARGGREIVLVELARDRSAARWARPAHPFMDLSGGFALAPEFGGELAARCSATCNNSIGPGGFGLVHLGYAFPSGLELGGSVGFVSIASSRTETDIRLLDPVGDSLPQQLGGTRDTLRINAAALGFHGGFQFGDRFPITARLAAGVLLGSFIDDRTGNFEGSDGASTPTGTVRESPSFAYAYVGPEARIGYRLRENVVVSVGVFGFALIGLAKPSWNNKHLVNAGVDGAGTYPNETLAGDVAFMVAPSLGLRYDF